MKDDQANVLQVKLVSARNLKESQTKAIPLHTYQSTGLAIIFVYGNDMERQQNNIFISFYGDKSTQFIIVFHYSIAAVLCYMRRRHRIPRNDYVSCWLDIFASFFGGGSFRATHRFERWIIGISYVGNFFLLAIWSGLIFYPSFYKLDQSIKSIKEIVSINPPIFIHPDLSERDQDALNLLR